MKRDLDLIKRILVAVEYNQKPTGWIAIQFGDVSDETISYHIKLLYQAGLLEAEDLSTKDGFEWKAISLTWDGHEFLDAARNEAVWKKVKKIITEKGGSIPFEIVKALLVSVAKEVVFGNSAG